MTPERLIAARGDELELNPHALADEERGAFDDGVHVQLASDLRKRLRGPFVLHRAGSGDDAQGLQARQIRDQRPGHPVGEVILGRVVGNVVERENGE